MTSKNIKWLSSLKSLKRSGKLCIVGEGGVGKTSLIKVLCSGMSIEETKDKHDIKRTPYMDISIYKAPNGYKVQIYDLSGQRFSAHPIEVLKKQVLVNLDAIIFAYSISNFNSLIDLTPWFNDVINFMNANDLPVPPFFLIGNKVDLIDDREVPPEMPMKIVQQRNQFKEYIEVSAYTGQGINILINKIMKSMEN